MYKALLSVVIAILMVACQWLPLSVTEPDATPSPSPIATRVRLLPPFVEPNATSSPLPVEATSARLTVSPNPAEIGDTVTVRLELVNEGTLAVGIPQFRIQGTESLFGEPIAAPANDGTLYGSVVPGEAYAMEWVFMAQTSGSATVSGSVSYEVHQGYPGPAYWSAVTAPPVEVTVNE